jgi:hypothetical protein
MADIDLLSPKDTFDNCDPNLIDTWVASYIQVVEYKNKDWKHTYKVSTTKLVDYNWAINLLLNWLSIINEKIKILTKDWELDKTTFNSIVKSQVDYLVSQTINGYEKL